MDTRLILGAGLTALSLVVITICYLGARNPIEPKWTNDTIMGSFIIPLCVGGIMMGGMFLFEGFVVRRALLTTVDILVSLGILAAGVITLLMMRIKKRLAAYEALGKNSQTSITG